MRAEDRGDHAAELGFPVRHMGWGVVARGGGGVRGLHGALDEVRGVVGDGDAAVEGVDAVGAAAGGGEVVAVEEEAGRLEVAGGEEQAGFEVGLRMDGEGVWVGGHDGLEVVVVGV